VEHRFEVRGDICFVKLLSSIDGAQIGLVLRGEGEVQRFAEAAIAALDQVWRNKRSNGACVLPPPAIKPSAKTKRKMS
jgi:hypothetical protein